MPEIPRRVGRTEMYTSLGLIRVVDPILEAQYKAEEDAYFKRDMHDARSKAWHTSFHASSFPLDDPKACARKALYGLMNIPSNEPFSTGGRALMEAGIDIEQRTTDRFQRAGVLLSDVGLSGEQTEFIDKKYWLVGNVDSIILPPGWNKPHVVEIKTKDHDKVEGMIHGMRGFDPGHRRQLMTYIWFTRMWHDALGFAERGLKPADDGTIIYISRGRPRTTYEFRIEYDAGAVEQGLETLAEWQRLFVNGELPPRDKTWKWTEEPCKWCSVKKLCKADGKNNISSLDQSEAIDYAKMIHSGYDYEEVRAIVLERWSN